MKQEFNDLCNCPQSLRQAEQIEALKEIIIYLNLGHPEGLGGISREKTLELLPVGIAKYNKTLDENKELKKQLEHRDRWIKKLLSGKFNKLINEVNKKQGTDAR